MDGDCPRANLPRPVNGTVGALYPCRPPRRRFGDPAMRCAGGKCEPATQGLRRLGDISQQVDLTVQSQEEAINPLPLEDRMELRAMYRQLTDRAVEVNV
jgi:hypothetical protein